MRGLSCFLALTTLCAAPIFAQEPPPAATPTPIAQARPTQPQPPRPTATPRPASQAPQIPQPPQAPAAPSAPPAPPAPPRAESIPTQNIRVELTINDSFASGTKKSINMLVAEGRNGRIRSQSHGFDLNVDARPLVMKDGRIELDITLGYNPDPATTAGPGPGMITESLTLLVADGKPTAISQSADPTSDRKVTVELTATIVK
jgi:hypothetical protein